jgi:CAAX prenyl protease-like protein
MERFMTPSVLARCLPFVLFMVLLAIRGNLPADSAALDPRWVYGVSVVLVSASLAWFWRKYGELLRANWLSTSELLLSVAVGVVVYYLWIRMDLPWMTVGSPTASFKPIDANGDPMWGLIVIRWVGAALMVPVMEELFWRSFLMRWVDNPDFEKVDARRVTFKAMLMSSCVFALAHTLWLGAIVAGLLYAWLYKRTGKLWAPIVAHAVTNGVLGVWVVMMGQWQFW